MAAGTGFGENIGSLGNERSVTRAAGVRAENTMAEDSQAIGTDDVILRRHRTQVLDKLIGDAELFVQIRDQLSRLSESEARSSSR